MTEEIKSVPQPFPQTELKLLISKCVHCGEPLWDNGTVAVHLKLIIHEGKPTVLQTQWCDASKKTIGETALASVPTESRRPNRLCSNCGVELFANYQEAGWNHCDREMKPFGNGCKFDGLFACAGKCQCPANTEMLGEFAASSSLLPVPRKPCCIVQGCNSDPVEHYCAEHAKELPVGRQLEDVIEVVKSSAPGTDRPDVWHVYMFGDLVRAATFSTREQAIERAELLRKVLNKLASLPVGESTKVQPCKHCGHANPHDGPAGTVDDACTEKGCNCGFYQPELGLGESREPLPGDVSKSSNETRNI